MTTYKLDFLEELDKAIKGNAHFFICEKAYRLEEPTPNSIRINMGGPGRRPHESCWNFVLEALLNHKFGIRYLECNGSWNDYSSGDHIEDMQFIICCKPLLTPISMDEFKEVGLKFARKNKAPGIIFNDYERKTIQLIRFDSEHILEIPHDKFSFIKHLGYLYNFNADTLYNYTGPKKYNSDWGYPWIVGHHIRPDEEFFEFENQGFYKLKLDDYDFQIIFNKSGITERKKSVSFNEELEIMKNTSAIMEYTKYPVQSLEINIHETSSENIEFIHSAILYAKGIVKLPFIQVAIRIYSDCRDLRIISNTSERDHIYFMGMDE